MLITLALCGGFAPFAIDTYLPGLPQISRDFHTAASLAQVTLTAFLIPLGLMQLVIGPLSDQVGRRKPLLIGLAGSVLAAVLCAVAPSIWVLILARALQGMCGATAVVLSRAVVADLGKTPAGIGKAFATVIAIQSIAPAVAPVVGGLLVPSLGWRGVFWFLAGLGALMVIAVAVIIDESLDEENRQPRGLRSAGEGFVALLGTREFLTPTVMFWSTFAPMFAYIAGSPFVLQDIAGFSQRQFALAFGINSLALLTASVTTGRIIDRLGHLRIAQFAVTLMAVAIVWLAMAVVGLDTRAWAVVPGFFVLVIGNGMLFPVLSSLAVAGAGARAGSASALLGAGQFVLAAVVAPLTGLGGGVTAAPMVTIMMLASVVQLTLFTRLRRLARQGVYDHHRSPRPND